MSQNKKFEPIYDIDHKYSKLCGFLNGIPPDIIGHYKNLEILTMSDNRTKSSKCSITLNELKTLVGNFEQISVDDVKFKLRKNKNSTGYPGVSYNKNSKKFISSVRFNKKRIFLGLFDNAIDAAILYQKSKLLLISGEVTMFDNIKI